MADTDRQAEPGSWVLPVRIHAGDSLADVQARVLETLRGADESHAPSPIPHLIAQRLLAEAEGAVTAWTGYTAHPNASFNAQEQEALTPSEAASTAGPEPGPEGDGRATAADEPRERGYSVRVTTHRFLGPIRCRVCECLIKRGESYKAIQIGCERFRVHDACLARVQHEIAVALRSDLATDDEPEEDEHGND